MKHRLSCLLASTAILVAQPGSAQNPASEEDQAPQNAPGAAAEVTADDSVDLGTITVTANQTDTALERSGATVEVLPAEDVEDAPTSRLSDFLAFEPGVSASASGPLGTNSNVRIRGLGGANVPVEIDGIKVNDPASTGNGFDFGGLTNAGLGRIEILKGSQSARFGQNAVGGVINIESRRPTEDGVHGFAEAETGNYDFGRGVLGLTARTDRTDLSFSISRTETDGFSASAAGTEDDGFDSTQANLYLRHQVSDVFAAGLSALYIDSETEFDEGAAAGDGGPPFDEFTEAESYGVRAFAELNAGAFDHEVALSYFERERKTFSTDRFSNFPTPIFFSLDRFKGERRRLEYRGSYDRGGIWILNFGADYEEEEDLDQEIDITGLQAELLIAPTDALDLAFSLRNDDHSDFDSELSSRAALAWRIRDDLILRASASDGFRAPALIELNPNFGDPDFEPEESISYELGIEKRLASNGFLRATLFHTEIDDKITFNDQTFKFEVGDFETTGIELSGQVEINEYLTLTGAYTFTDVEENGTTLSRVPEHDFALGLGAQFTPRLDAQFTLQHAEGFVTGPFDPPVNKVGDYTVFHVNGAYEINETVEAYLRVENLFDEDYETAAGFNTAGQSAHVGLRANF